MKALSKLVIACLTIELALSLQVAVVDPEGIPLDEFRKPAPPLPSNCRDRLVCESNNDPHMVNFWNYHFEFQNKGQYCLHETRYVSVSASFYQCPSPWQAATCNCNVTIKLYNGETASISNCGSASFQIDTLTLSPSSNSVGCDPVTNNQFDPLDESDWALLPVNSGNSFFLCAQVNGDTYIKTRLSNSDHNVIVKVTPGMSSLNVFSSRIYRASPTINRRCLCERRQGRTFQEHNEFWTAELKNNEIELCQKDLLINSNCYREIVQPLLNEENVEEINKLALNCAIDLQAAGGKEEQVGAFQKNEIQVAIYKVIVKAFGDDALEVIAKLCECESKRPNFDCIQFGKCEKGFALCLE